MTKQVKSKQFIALFVVSIENLNTLKYHTFSKKKTVFSVICNKCECKDDEESIEILKILGLVTNI